MTGPAVRALAAALPLALAVAWPSAAAITYANQSYTCPIDGQVFTQSLPSSGQPQGSMLDLKPWGPVIAPFVLPVCPGNRFVLWKRNFDDAEVKRYRELVASPRWLAIRDTESDYYRIARLRQWSGDPAVDVAFTFLFATWEVDNTPDRYARYAQDALGAIDTALASLPANDPRTETLRLLTVELERRLGHFDAAADRLKAASSSPDAMDPPQQTVAGQQRALIAARDAGPHRMDTPPPEQ
jgi:hypothetical protein